MYSVLSSTFCYCGDIVITCVESEHGEQEVVFMLAAAYAGLGRYQSAYDQLSAVLEDGAAQAPILDEIYLLHAQMCIKLHSDTVALYQEALKDYDYLVENHPEDMNIVCFDFE